ncbi:MAG: SDR family NAD(P)-dependent oxidoreductase [Janthinobacterium lividum]
MTDQAKTTALITGASTGIGATYADRLARRGYNLVLVARNRERMETLAASLRAETGATIDIIGADLTDAPQLLEVEARLRDDASINLLVNNAGAAVPGGFAEGDVALQERLIRLNVTAVTRLSAAVIPRYLAQGGGDIINITSVVALAPELPLGMYGATKAYVLAYSQALNVELGARGIYVQAVLPAATRTEIWERSGRDVNTLSGVMEVGELVDAALVGFERRELVTIPPLPEAAQWEAFNAARVAMLPNFSQEHAAERYRG